MSKKKKRAVAARHMTAPRDLDRWLDRSGQQLIAGDFPGVIATARRVVQAPIASPQQRADAYDRLGAAHMMLQQHAEAYAMTTAALALRPDDPMLWYNHGMTTRYTTRFGQSLRAFEQAAALDVDGALADKIAEALPFARSIVKDERALRGPHFTLDS